MELKLLYVAMLRDASLSDSYTSGSCYFSSPDTFKLVSKGIYICIERISIYNERYISLMKY